MSIPIVWTIAGSDSGGGAGIQADLHAFNCLGVHGCSVITAVTAQNSFAVEDIHYMPGEQVLSQMQTLQKDLPAQAIKIGMLGHPSIIKQVVNFLSGYSGYIVFDPVMISTSEAPLFSSGLSEYVADIKHLFSLCDLITPNLREAENIFGRPITSFDEVEEAAAYLLSLGAKNVLIKGGHFDDDQFSQDYWSNGAESFWLACERQIGEKFHGAGCTLSSAIAAYLALGHDLKDALVLAKMYTTRGIRLANKCGSGPAVVAHTYQGEHQKDLPYVSQTPLTQSPQAFPACDIKPLGIYPIVDSLDWMRTLLPLGIHTLQLRIKDNALDLEYHIQQAIMMGHEYGTQLFINDHWEFAIKHHAYGVHLGQEDLATADIKKIQAAGLRLGISTHSYYELARAHAYRPSYIAFGPIFPTDTKILSTAPQGISKLSRWRKMLDYPLVAIGGISMARLPEVLATGVNGVAIISAITRATDPVKITKEMMRTSASSLRAAYPEL